MSEYILEVADGSWADHEYVCDEWHRIELDLNKAKMTKLIRCGDCRFGDTYAPDRGFRDCRMMCHKIVPSDCYCAIGRPKEVEE